MTVVNIAIIVLHILGSIEISTIHTLFGTYVGDMVIGGIKAIYNFEALVLQTMGSWFAMFWGEWIRHIEMTLQAIAIIAAKEETFFKSL